MSLNRINRSADTKRMSRFGEVVDRLREALRLERQLMDLYKNAGDRARDNHTARILHGISERHASHAERLTHLVDRLERAAGEGFFGELMESIGEAISGMLATIPVMIVESGTDATFDTLGRYEGTLVGTYESLASLLDEESAHTIAALAEDCRHHMEKLVELDPLS
jgi:rubrerythrin